MKNMKKRLYQIFVFNIVSLMQICIFEISIKFLICIPFMTYFKNRNVHLS
jgi:hypothetical protein